MDKEIFIREFLERLDDCVDAEVEPCDCDTVVKNMAENIIDEVPKLTDAQKIFIRGHSTACDVAATATLDKQAARAALDRLFKDLQDFAGVIITNGTSGGVIGFSKGSVLREVIADKIEKQKTKRKIK